MDPAVARCPGTPRNRTRATAGPQRRVLRLRAVPQRVGAAKPTDDRAGGETRCRLGADGAVSRGAAWLLTALRPVGIRPGLGSSLLLVETSPRTAPDGTQLTAQQVWVAAGTGS